MLKYKSPATFFFEQNQTLNDSCSDTEASNRIMVSIYLKIKVIAFQ